MTRIERHERGCKKDRWSAGRGGGEMYDKRTCMSVKASDDPTICSIGHLIIHVSSLDGSTRPALAVLQYQKFLLLPRCSASLRTIMLRVLLMS
jgi:hypothetical protein